MQGLDGTVLYIGAVSESENLGKVKTVLNKDNLPGFIYTTFNNEQL